MILPLTPLEDAVVLSERAWPVTIALEAHLAGHLDATRLAVALDVARRTHPLASARRRPVRGLARRQTWEVVDDLDVDPLTVTALEGPTSLAATRDGWCSQPVPVHRAPLFRVLLARLPDHDVLVVKVHHGMADGLGAVRFLRTALAAYDEGPLARVHPDLSTADLAARAARAGGPATVGGGPPVGGPPAGSDPGNGHPGPGAGRWSGLAAVVGGPSAARLAGTGGRGGEPGHHVALATAALPPRPWGGTTVNDVLLTAVHLAAARWNARHGGPPGPITVTVPVSARTPAQGRGVVGNLTLQATTRTEPGAHARPARPGGADDAGSVPDPRAVLAAVTAQTGAWRQGPSDAAGAATEPAADGLLGALPVRVRGALPAVVSRLTGDRFVATTRLSNLGAVEPLAGRGAARVTALWFSPPVRPPQGLTLGAVGYGDRLHLAARSCRSQWDARGTAAFLEACTAALADLAAGVGPLR